MPRPKVSLDTQRRLYQIARDVSDDVSPNPSHEEALTAILDYCEESQTEEVEVIGDIGFGDSQDSDPFGGV